MHIVNFTSNLYQTYETAAIISLSSFSPNYLLLYLRQKSFKYFCK
jgi:hypothetical protein